MTRSTKNSLTIIPAVAFAIAVLVAIGVSLFNIARPKMALSACINNLRQIESAAQLWADEHNANSNSVVTWRNLAPYIKGGVLKCPHGGAYTIGRVDELPRCSIMHHNIGFGRISVADESGAPLADARVEVLGRGTEICSAQTSTNGELYMFEDWRPGANGELYKHEAWRLGLRDHVITNSWSDGTKQIVAWKEGYRTSSIALPTSDWPLRFVLTNAAERQ